MRQPFFTLECIRFHEGAIAPGGVYFLARFVNAHGTLFHSRFYYVTPSGLGILSSIADHD